MPESDPVERKLALSEEDFRILERMAAEQGRSLNETARRAIINDHFFRERMRKGEKVLVYKKDRSFDEITFK